MPLPQLACKLVKPVLYQTAILLGPLFGPHVESGARYGPNRAKPRHERGLGFRG